MSDTPFALANGKLAADAVIALPAGTSLSRATTLANVALALIAKNVIAELLPHHLIVELYDDPDDMEPRLHIGRLGTTVTLDLGSNAEAATISEYIEHCDEDELQTVLGPALAELDHSDQLPELFENLFDAALRIAGPNPHKFYHPKVAALQNEQNATGTTPERCAAITAILEAVGSKAIRVEEAERLTLASLSG